MHLISCAYVYAFAHKGERKTSQISLLMKRGSILHQHEQYSPDRFVDYSISTFHIALKGWRMNSSATEGTRQDTLVLAAQRGASTRCTTQSAYRPTMNDAHNRWKMISDWQSPQQRYEGHHLEKGVLKKAVLNPSDCAITLFFLHYRGYDQCDLAQWCVEQ